MRVARLGFVVVSSALFFAAPRASAAPLTDRQVAQSLFEQARELMAKGDYVKACPMLAESQRLDPGGGTRLNLALCYEGEGKLATAQLELNDALGQAVKDGRSDRETIAREHLAALASRVPKLTLVAPAQPVRGLVIELDGITMSAAASGVSLPVDPGPHEIRASAPGYVAWTSSPKLREAESLRVQVPALVKVGAVAERPAPAAAAPAPASPVVERKSFNPTAGFSTASWVFVGVSAAALTASIVTGVIALNTRSDFEKRCLPARDFCANPKDAELAISARTFAWVSTGLLVAAVSAAATAWFQPRKSVAEQLASGRPLRFEF